MLQRFACFAARVLAPAVIVVLFGATDAFAQKRVALVIGNGAYEKVPALPNPSNDAGDMAASLQRLGFTVRKLSNARFDDMRRGLIEFGREARGAEMAIVFFAGHGMEIGGENWLIPTDAELRNDSDAENEAISLRAVTAQVSNASQFGLVILDACRNNPFAAKMTRSLRTRTVAQGLARTEPTDNVLIAYAAKDGTTANDGDGRNSPFTAALLRNIEQPGLEVTFMFRNVRDEVMQTTKREQQPFVYGSLSKDAIYLKSGPAAPAAPVATAPAAPPPAPVAAAPAPTTSVASAAPTIEAPPRLASPQPAAVPSGAGEADDLQAGGLFTPQDAQRLQGIATRHQIPLPNYRLRRPNPAVPPALRKFVGVWASKIALGNGRGRQVIMIITDVDASGRVSGHYGFGPPTPASPDNFPANSVVFAGQIERDTLRFELRVGTISLRPTTGDNLHMTLQRRDGLTPTTNLETVWRLAEREQSASRQVPRTQAR